MPWLATLSIPSTFRVPTPSTSTPDRARRISTKKDYGRSGSTWSPRGRTNSLLSEAGFTPAVAASTHDYAGFRRQPPARLRGPRRFSPCALTCLAFMLGRVNWASLTHADARSSRRPELAAAHRAVALGADPPSSVPAAPHLVLLVAGRAPPSWSRRPAALRCRSVAAGTRCSPSAGASVPCQRAGLTSLLRRQSLSRRSVSLLPHQQPLESGRCALRKRGSTRWLFLGPLARLLADHAADRSFQSGAALRWPVEFGATLT